MGRVIGFSELPRYLAERTIAPELKATILDSNILITTTYDAREDYDEVINALAILEEENYRLFATVNTRAEYLEYQRRIILTESLLDSIDEHSTLRIPKKARAKISALKGTIKTAAQADPERDIVFNDTHLKKIKHEFSAGDHSGQMGWLAFCEKFLGKRLNALDSDLLSSGIEYVSQHEPSQRALFTRRIDWPEAVEISEKTGVSFADSMILNAFRCSRCPFIVSRDFDIGYAVLADSTLRDAIMPDRMAREYRNYHFN